MFAKQDLVNMLVDQEKLRLKPYTDTKGKLSIGIGRNLTDVGISRSEAFYLCSNDIDNAINELRANIDEFDSLPDNIQLALSDLCFNMGIGTLLTFHNTLAYINQGDYADAAKELLNSDWSRDVGPTRSLTIANLIKNA